MDNSLQIVNTNREMQEWSDKMYFVNPNSSKRANKFPVFSKEKNHFQMYSVLLPIISMISLEYSRYSCITRSSFLFADMWKICKISFRLNNKLFLYAFFNKQKSGKQAKVFRLWYNDYHKGYYLWALRPNHYNLRRLKKWLRQLIKLLKFSWEMLLI